MAWPIPADEAQRRTILPAYDLFGSPPEPEYDAVTATVAAVLDAPICLITVMGERSQWFKSGHGAGMQATSREMAFCAHTILGDDVLVVPDALQDARFRSNAFVVGPPFVRFYAGAPIASAEGIRMGALCIVDTRPRTLPDLAILARMAALTATLFDKRRQDRARRPDIRPATPVATIEKARGMLHHRGLLRDSVSTALFDDPAMAIILRLFMARREHRSCTVSELGKADDIPFSSAQRWVNRFVDEGLVAVGTDPSDQRKGLVRLTDFGTEMMDQWLARAA
jgi:hypothetical protein